MSKTLILVAGLLLGASAAAQAPKAPAEPLAPLQRLVGSWTGTGKGKPGTSRVEQRFGFALGRRYLHAELTATFPVPAKGGPAPSHSELGYFSYDKVRGKLVLRQFHQEGFVNTYVLERAEADTLVFVTESIENLPAGWRARETFHFTGPDTYTQRFEVAAPGKDFEPYSENHFQRQPDARPAEASKTAP